MLYSLRSFASDRAFPFTSSLCASAGGAEGNAASCAFIAEMVSVGCTLRVKVAAGLRDLNTRGMAVSEKKIFSAKGPLNATMITHRTTNSPRGGVYEQGVVAQESARVADRGTVVNRPR